MIRELPGTGGSGLVITDESYTVKASMSGATIICRPASALTVSVPSFSTPGISYTVANHGSGAVYIKSLAGEVFSDPSGVEVLVVTVDPGSSFHIIYDADARKWEAPSSGGSGAGEADLQKIAMERKLLSMATTCAGFLSEAEVSDEDYPRKNSQNYAFKMSRFNEDTLEILATGPVCFNDGQFGPTGRSIVSFPRRTERVTQLAIPGEVVDTDSMYFVYVGIDSNGDLQLSRTSTAGSQKIAELGQAVLVRRGGKTTISAWESGPVMARPALAGVNSATRKSLGYRVEVVAGPTVGLRLNMKIKNTFRENIGWPFYPASYLGTRHQSEHPGEYFIYRVHSKSLTSGFNLGPKVKEIDPQKYDKSGSGGSPTADVPNGWFTVQRCLMHSSGPVFFQYGSNIYRSLNEGIADMYESTQVFEDIMDNGQLVEFARIVVSQSATDLSDPAQAYISMSPGSTMLYKRPTTAPALDEPATNTPS